MADDEAANLLLGHVKLADVEGKMIIRRRRDQRDLAALIERRQVSLQWHLTGRINDVIKLPVALGRHRFVVIQR